jgi:hypothetical protein
MKHNTGLETATPQRGITRRKVLSSSAVSARHMEYTLARHTGV